MDTSARSARTAYRAMNMQQQQGRQAGKHHFTAKKTGHHPKNLSHACVKLGLEFIRTSWLTPLRQSPRLNCNYIASPKPPTYPYMPASPPSVHIQCPIPSVSSRHAPYWIPFPPSTPPHPKWPACIKSSESKKRKGKRLGVLLLNT